MDNITENNRLIAEFMGYNEEIINDEVYFTLPDMLESLSDEELHYHSDWNWLMEVVDKIQLLDIVHDNTRNYDNVFKEWQCTFSPTYTTHDFGYIVGKSKNSEIESVYNACIEFIKWSNKQK